MGKSNIVLTGFMYSGKTTVGRLVAEATGKTAVDTDGLIEAEAGIPVSRIFERDGETGFRRMERRVVSRVAVDRDTVISLGGGAVLDPENVDDLKRDGVVYYLEVSAPVVARRAQGGMDRPLLSGLSETRIEQLLSERREHYLRAADVRIRAESREPASIADEIVRDFARRARKARPRGGGSP